MSRTWESVYANLGDVSDCLRDALRTLRKELPRCAAGQARGTASVDVQANLEQRIAEIQALIGRVEQDRSDFYLSHTPEVGSTEHQPNILFGARFLEA